MKWIIAVSLSVLATACAWDNGSVLEKPQPDYPCGTGWHRCSDGRCCGNTDACGGDPGCPRGTCCFVGELRLSDAGPG